MIASLLGAAAVALPAFAGAGLPASSGCTPALCDARRPDPSIALSAAAPRVGASVVLTASSPGRSVSFAWDLDGDGAFDDAVGARVVSEFGAGTTVVRVRAADVDGRVGMESRTVIAHAANVPPGGSLRVLTPSPSAAVGIEVSGADADGHVARIDGDLDGDGTFETTDLFAVGEDAVATHSYRDPGLGEQTIHARVVDDAGAVTVLSAEVQVHLGNLDPLASLAAAVTGDRVSLSATARDPDGQELDYQFDLDGDGVYELDSATDSSAAVTLGPGSHEVGVRVTDGAGGEAVVRRSVFVGAGPALDVVVPPGVVRPGAPATFTAVAPAGSAILWDLDDDGAFDDAAGDVAGRTFAAPGAYFVRARVSERVELRTVTVRADAGLMPIVDALSLPSVIPAGRPAAFTAAASDPDGGDVTLAFDLDGDGAFDDVPSRAADGSFVWTFDAPVEIAVRASDGSGHSAVSRASVVPVAGDLPSDVSLAVGPLQAGVPAQLVATAADGAWDLDGDGAFDDGTGKTVTFTPAAPGEITIAVRAGDTVVRRTVTVGTAPPVAAFGLAGTTLTSTSSDPDGAPLAAQTWDLDGDGAFDDATGPVAQLDPTGPALVGLKVRDAGDDIAIAYETVDPGGQATPTPTPTATATPTATPTATATASPSATAAAPPATPAATASPPPIANIAPAARLSLSTSLRAPTRSALLRRGIEVSMACSEACRVTVIARVSPAVARRLRLGRSGELGRASRRLAAHARSTSRVPLSAKARSAAAKDRRNLRVELTFTAIGAGDRRAVARRSVIIRR